MQICLIEAKFLWKSNENSLDFNLISIGKPMRICLIEANFLWKSNGNWLDLSLISIGKPMQSSELFQELDVTQYDSGRLNISFKQDLRRFDEARPTLILT